MCHAQDVGGRQRLQPRLRSQGHGAISSLHSPIAPGLVRQVIGDICFISAERKEG
ncbi:MAG: hypothetical protein N2235_05555 [Fischerella sp.]|nr:hypothetical protein [Fischerella sp.]